MLLDAKHDDLLVLINRIARVLVQVKAPVEVIKLRLACSNLGFPIHHLVVVLDRFALVGRVGGIGSNHHVYVGRPFCVLGYR
ncbi:hypothetical protein D9M68_873130 [compost metagenome]